MNKKSTKWLKKEIEVWQKEGLITSAAAQILKDRYHAKEKAIEEIVTWRRLVVTFLLLGFIFISLGAVVFFIERWTFIPDCLKLLIIVCAMCGAYIAGFYIKFHKEHPRIGGSFLLLGAVLFGCGLFINNQIFNLNLSLKDNIIFWFISILPVAYFAYSKKVLHLALILISIWLGIEAANWIDLQSKSELYIYLYYFFGIFIYAVGIAHNQVKKLNVYKGPYQIIGGFLLLGAIYLLTFLDTIPEGFFIKLNISADLKNILIIATFGLLLLLVELGFKKGRQHLLAVQIYSLITALTLGVLSIFGLFAGLDVLIFNILFLALIAGLVIVGINTKEMALMNLGMVFFTIDIISRYFDVFWQLLPRFIFFILGGAILILGGIYVEIARRRLLQRIRW